MKHYLIFNLKMPRFYLGILFYTLFVNCNCQPINKIQKITYDSIRLDTPINYRKVAVNQINKDGLLHFLNKNNTVILLNFDTGILKEKELDDSLINLCNRVVFRKSEPLYLDVQPSFFQIINTGQIIKPPFGYTFSIDPKGTGLYKTNLIIRTEKKDLIAYEKELYAYPNYLVYNFLTNKVVSHIAPFPITPYQNGNFYNNLRIEMQPSSYGLALSFPFSDSILTFNDTFSSNWISIQTPTKNKPIPFDLSKVEDFRYIKKYFNLNTINGPFLIDETKNLIYQTIIFGTNDSRILSGKWMIRISNYQTGKVLKEIIIKDEKLHPHLFLLLENGNLIVGRKGAKNGFFKYANLKL